MYYLQYIGVLRRWVCRDNQRFQMCIASRGKTSSGIPWVSSESNQRSCLQACWVSNINRVSDNSLSIEWIWSVLLLAPLARLLSIKSWSRLCLQQFLEYWLRLHLLSIVHGLHAQFLEYWVDPTSASARKTDVEYQISIASASVEYLISVASQMICRVSNIDRVSDNLLSIR